MKNIKAEMQCLCILAENEIQPSNALMLNTRPMLWLLWSSGFRSPAVLSVFFRTGIVSFNSNVIFRVQIKPSNPTNTEHLSPGMP